MPSNGLISILALMTIGVAAIVAIVVLVRFLRKRENRHPMENQRERNIDEIQRGVPPER